MNDFLQSIRGHQKEKRTPKTRRNFDNGNFNTAQNFTPSPNFQNQGHYQSTRTANLKRPASRGTSHVHLPGDEVQPSYPPQLDPVDMMLNILDIYTKNQEMMLAIEEQRVIAEERKAIALEEIAEYLRVITMPSFHEKFGFKSGKGRPAEEMRADCSEQADSYDDDDKPDIMQSESFKSDKSSKAYKVLKPYEVIESELVESEPVESPVDDLHGADKVVSDQYGDNSVVDAEYIDTNLVKDDHYIKPSERGFAGKRTFEERDNEESVKVIRRKRVDNTKETICSPSEAISNESKEDAKQDTPLKREVVTPQNGILSDQERVQTEQVAADSLLSRDEVLEIINSMRAKGKTFDEVAKHLVSLNQPTFSGRGDWHAQTIHRICTRDERKAKAGMISKKARKLAD